MLYFNKIKSTLDADEKHRSTSILNFICRNDAKFAQDVIIKQNGTVIDFSSLDVYMTIIPLNSSGIVTNYSVTADANGQVSLSLTASQIQSISTTDSASREFRIRKNDSDVITDIAIGKLKIETYPVSSSEAGASDMIYEHTIGEGAEFDFTVNTDNVVVTDIVDADTGQSIRSGVEITYDTDDNSKVTINLYTDRSVNVYYTTFND